MSELGGPVPIEEMLQHAAWARRLARSLVSDPQRAEDLAQDAWVAALRRPPDDRRSVRSWLSRVIRNRAIEMYRYESRRKSEELPDVARATSQDVADSVGRAEQTRVVAELVLTLPDEQRDVLVLRYMDDLSPSQIAERLGIPEGTVRSRAFRGLARMREILDGRSRDEGREWRPAMALLAFGAAGPPAPPVFAWRAGRLAATGAMLCAVGVGMWWWSGRGDVEARDVADVHFEGGYVVAGATPGVPDSSSGLSRPDTRADTRVDVVEPPVAPQLDPVPEPEPEPPPPPRLTIRGPLSGTVLAADDDVALRCRLLSIALDPDADRFVGGVATASGYSVVVDGAEHAVADAIELEITTDDPRYVPLTSQVVLPQAPVNGSSELTGPPVELVLAGTLSGRLVDEDGRAIEGAASAAYPVVGKRPTVFPSDECTTDADGRFRLRLRPGVVHWFVFEHADRVPEMRRVTAPEGGSDSELEITLTNGHTLAGTIHMPPGYDATRASLLMLRRKGVPPVQAPSDWLVRPTREGAVRANALVELDADGAFELRGLRAVPVGILIGTSDGTGGLIRSTAQTIELPSDPLDLRWEGGVVRFAVHSTGVPVAGAKIDVVAEGGDQRKLTTNDDGTAVVLPTPGMPYVVTVRASGYAVATHELIGPPVDETESLTIPLEPLARSARWGLTLSTEGDTPLTAVGVRLKAADPSSRLHEKELRFDLVAGEDGRFETPPVPAGLYDVTLRPGGPWLDPRSPYRQETLSVHLLADEVVESSATARPGGHVRLVVDRHDRPSGTCVVTVRDAEGNVVPASFRSPQIERSGTHLVRCGHPTWIVPPLPPGRYELEAKDKGVDPVVRTVEVRVGEIAEVTIPLTER